MPPEPPGPSEGPAVLRALAFGAAALAYQALLVAAVRSGVWAEAAITLGLPLACWAAGWLKADAQPRVVQLLAFESLFNLLAVGARWSAQAGHPALGAACGYGIAGFFVLQLGGFLAHQARGRSWQGLLQTGVGAALLALWFVHAPQAGAVVDADGRLLFWGQDAPTHLQVAYAAWAGAVLLAQTRSLPNGGQAIAHLASIGLALGSGEFFHVRLVTAAHLFLLDACLGFANPRGEHLAARMPHLPVRWRPAYDASVRPAVTALGTAVGLGALLVALGT